MKSINKRILFIATIFFGLPMTLSFIGAWAEDERTLGTNIICTTFAKLFNILRFPTHTLLWTYISRLGAPIYFSGLFINCVLYSFITERIIHLLKTKKV
ncbi:hypothetical protein [Flavobacterium limnophilum]|uniref:hypothetical protein n=1 Tax=Flavobacterium limnophilum TaxID=3003262 RepID=UPI0022AC8E9A|nr:hypothetical protein [Flavobacterium limnophilum]